MIQMMIRMSLRFHIVSITVFVCGGGGGGRGNQRRHGVLKSVLEQEMGAGGGGVGEGAWEWRILSHTKVDASLSQIS